MRLNALWGVAVKNAIFIAFSGESRQFRPTNYNLTLWRKNGRSSFSDWNPVRFFLFKWWLAGPFVKNAFGVELLLKTIVYYRSGVVWRIFDRRKWRDFLNFFAMIRLLSWKFWQRKEEISWQEQSRGCYFKRDVSNPLASVLSYSATARPALAQLVNARPARSSELAQYLVDYAQLSKAIVIKFVKWQKSVK